MCNWTESWQSPQYVQYDRKTIRREILNYIKAHTGPVSPRKMTADLRRGRLEGTTTSTIRDMYQAMIVTGKLKYTYDLKIALVK